MVTAFLNCTMPFSLVKLIQWRNSCYETFYGPIVLFLVTFYSVYEVKCDQKMEYGTMKSLIVKISSL